MIEGKTPGHRRREHRQYFPRAPVAWKTKGAGAWRTGWLNDLSASGAAMLVPMDTAPKAGQEVELCPDRQTGTLPCRVVRTEAREDNRDLVACRIISTDGCPARLRPTQDLSKARRQIPRPPDSGSPSKQISADLRGKSGRDVRENFYQGPGPGQHGPADDLASVVADRDRPGTTSVPTDVAALWTCRRKNHG